MVTPVPSGGPVGLGSPLDGRITVALDIRIDRELCMGSGNCSFWAPGVFDLDEEGISVLVDPAGQPDDKIVLAAQGCPTQAIAVFRDGEKLV